MRYTACDSPYRPANPSIAGYIGRFLALYLHNNNLASEVRLVDKQLPELAYLAPEFKDACSRDKFMQADASRERESTAQGSRPFDLLC